MIEIHKYSFVINRESIEAYLEDNDSGIMWVNYLNHAYPKNPYFKQHYWWGVPVYKITTEYPAEKDAGKHTLAVR